MYEFLLMMGVIAFLVYKFVKRGGYEKSGPSGKSILITGCDSGIGLSMAITAEKLGFHVIATCLNLYGNGANFMRENFPNISIVPMDVTKPVDIENALQIVKDNLQNTQTTLWSLVNNAGVLIYGHFDWQLDYQIESQVQVNYIGVLRVTKAFLPLIREAKGKWVTDEGFHNSILTQILHQFPSILIIHLNHVAMRSIPFFKLSS